MDKMDEIRQALIETYNKSFNWKEPTASLFSGIEVLMLMIDEHPEMFLSQFDERDIQMYNYLLNEMILELRRRNTERLHAEGIARNVIHFRNTRPITVQVDHNYWNRRVVVPNFEIPEDLHWPNLPPVSVASAAVDHRNFTPDFDLRANDQLQTSSGNIAQTIPPHSDIVMNKRNLDTELQKHNRNQTTSENIDKDIFSSTSEVQLLRNLADIEEPPMQPPLLVDAVPVEQRELIRDPDLQTSDAIRSNTLPITSEIQQFGDLVDVDEALINLPDPSPPLKRINLPSAKELSSKQQIQFDELEVNVPDIPSEDSLIQEFKELFERRRKEKAATDYAARAAVRAMRSAANLKYRDCSRNITHLRPISDEAHTLRVMPLFSHIRFSSISSQIQNLMISTSNQEWHQRSLTDRSLHTEFSNLIVHKPQSTPETPFSGKQKTKKWTSALPVLEEDQMDVQRAPEVLGDQDQVIIQSEPAESHQTPLTAKNFQREITSWKVTSLKSSLPVLQDEIEPPPTVDTSLRNPSEEQNTEIFVQKQMQEHSNPTYSDVITTENERLIYKQRRAKRPKLTNENAHPRSVVRNLAEDAVFQQYLKSWKKSVLINANKTHCDVHFPVDLLKMLDFGTPVHQILKEIVDSGDNPFSYFLPPTSTRKEASKRIHILLELRTQNVLDFIVQDGEVTGICIKY